MSWLRRLREAPVTAGLLILNLLLFGAMVAASERLMSFDVGTLISAGANVWQPPRAGVPDASALRWVTAAFVHVNAFHILLNMIVLVQLGVLSERFVGGGLLAMTYLITGVCGNAVSTAVAV